MSRFRDPAGRLFLRQAAVDSVPTDTSPRTALLTVNRSDVLPQLFAEFAGLGLLALAIPVFDASQRVG